MSARPSLSLTTPFQQLFTSGSLAALGEAGLLERFVNERDESAFEAIVNRFGPMVMGVCRGRLSDHRDAEDAFQATFLVLARKAGSIQRADRLGNWLFGVATKVSRRARAASFKRSSSERSLDKQVEVCRIQDSEISDQATRLELRLLVQEELSRLPGRLREAIVLCCIEELTHEQAADRLQIPLGTLKGRVARGKDKLRERLVRRGAALSAAVIASAITTKAYAKPSGALVSQTVHAALLENPVRAAAFGLISLETMNLTQGVLSTMFQAKILTNVGLAATAAFVTIVAVASRPSQDGEKQSPDNQPPRAESTEDSSSLGTGLAGTTGQARPQELQFHRAPGDTAKSMRRPLMIKGEPPVGGALPVSKAALQESLGGGGGGVSFNADPLFQLLGGNMFDVLEEDRGTTIEQIRHARLIKTLEKLDKNPQSAAIRSQLEQLTSFPFAEATPLQDFIKYLKQATQSSNHIGLQFYLNPRGLESAGTTPTSTVTLDLENIPIRTGLKLALDQLELSFYVRDGVVIVTSKEWVDDGLREAILEKTDIP